VICGVAGKYGEKSGEMGEKKRKLLCKFNSAMDSDRLESESTNFIRIRRIDFCPRSVLTSFLELICRKIFKNNFKK
jgi:hypothetical protein